MFIEFNNWLIPVINIQIIGKMLEENEHIIYLEIKNELTLYWKFKYYRQRRCYVGIYTANRYNYDC